MSTGAYYHDYYLQYRERYKQRAKAWALLNPEKRKASVDKYRWSDKGIDTKLNSTFLRQYGITLEQYNQMLIAQNNKCAICNQEETKQLKGVIQRLSVDHCHKTGKVRQLLCNRCNRLLALANDSIQILENALTYLRSSEYFYLGLSRLSAYTISTN